MVASFGSEGPARFPRSASLLLLFSEAAAAGGAFQGGEGVFSGQIPGAALPLAPVWVCRRTRQSSRDKQIRRLLII